MRNPRAFVEIIFLFVILGLSGCGDSRSVAISVNKGSDGEQINTLSTTDTVEISTRTEISPDVTLVRLWLCHDGGGYVFDDEYCTRSNTKKYSDIQKRVTERFSGYMIVKIERTRELFNNRPYTVFYVHLRKNS
jgi:hypothetical protein